MVAMLKLITIPAQGTRFLARAIMFRTLANLYSHGYKYFFADSWKVKPELSASKPAPDGSLTSDFPVWNMSFRYFFDWLYVYLNNEPRELSSKSLHYNHLYSLKSSFQIPELPFIWQLLSLLNPILCLFCAFDKMRTWVTITYLNLINNSAPTFVSKESIGLHGDKVFLRL